MAGLVLVKSNVDQVLGEAALAINVAFTRVKELKKWLDSVSDPDLTALGYSSGEITLLRAAWGDLNILYNIYVGDVNQPLAYDFRQSAQDLWGLGV